WGVLAVNLLGCLAIGVLAAFFIDRPVEDRLRFLLITGFLGSFTTFSAFGLDTFELLKANAITLALANVAASVMGGTALAAAGWFIAQRINTP
ncbi:MAG: CrcB family protein, partial [Planctomycetota bacterium]